MKSFHFPKTLSMHETLSDIFNTVSLLGVALYRFYYAIMMHFISYFELPFWLAELYQ